MSEVVRFPADFAEKSPEVNAVAFGLESTCVLTGGNDGVLRVWRVPGDVTRSTPPHLLLECPGHTGAIHAIAVDTMNGLAATGSADGSARVWYLPVLMGGSADDPSAFCWTLPAVAPQFITKPAAPRGGRKQRHKSAGAFKYAHVAFSGGTLVTLEASEFVSAFLLSKQAIRLLAHTLHFHLHRGGHMSVCGSSRKTQVHRRRRRPPLRC